MADHVRVREVDDHEAVAVIVDGSRNAVCDLGRRHLRLVVVARDVSGRVDEDPLLPRERLLAPAVEEVGDVRVLLGLRRVELADAVGREHLGEHVLDLLIPEDDREVEVVPVAGHCRQVDAALTELLGELPRAIGAEVEEDRGVASGIEARTAVDDGGLDELVRNSAVVARLDGGDRILGLLALPLDDGAERAFGAIPAVVAVHRVVAARDGRDAVGRQLGEIVHCRMRRDVTSVGERMDPRLLRRDPQQGAEMIDVRVNAAV